MTEKYRLTPIVGRLRELLKGVTVEKARGLAILRLYPDSSSERPQRKASWR